jgi:hypothetical protein
VTKHLRKQLGVGERTSFDSQFQRFQSCSFDSIASGTECGEVGHHGEGNMMEHSGSPHGERREADEESREGTKYTLQRHIPFNYENTNG